MSFLKRKKSSADPSISSAPSSPGGSSSHIPVASRPSPVSRLSLRRSQRSSLPLQTPPLPATPDEARYLPDAQQQQQQAEAARRTRRTSLKGLFSGALSNGNGQLAGSRSPKKSPSAAAEAKARPQSVVEQPKAASASAPMGGSLGRHKRFGSTPVESSAIPSTTGASVSPASSPWARRRLSSQPSAPAPELAARPSTPPPPSQTTAAAPLPITPPSSTATTTSLSTPRTGGGAHQAPSLLPIPASPSLAKAKGTAIPSPVGSRSPTRAGQRTAHDMLQSALAKAGSPPGSPASPLEGPSAFGHRRSGSAGREREGSVGSLPSRRQSHAAQASTVPAVEVAPLVQVGHDGTASPGAFATGATPAWWATTSSAADPAANGPSSSAPSNDLPTNTSASLAPPRPTPSPTPSSGSLVLPTQPTSARSQAYDERLVDERPTFLHLPLSVGRVVRGGEDDLLAVKMELDEVLASDGEADGGEVDLSDRQPATTEGNGHAARTNGSAGDADDRDAAGNGDRPLNTTTTAGSTPTPPRPGSSAAVRQPGSPVLYHLPARKQSHAFSGSAMATSSSTSSLKGEGGAAEPGRRVDVFGFVDMDESDKPAAAAVRPKSTATTASNMSSLADDDDEDDELRPPVAALGPPPASPAQILAAVRLERVAVSPAVSRVSSRSAASPDRGITIAAAPPIEVIEQENGAVEKIRAMTAVAAAAADDVDSPPIDPPKELSFFPAPPGGASPMAPVKPMRSRRRPSTRSDAPRPSSSSSAPLLSLPSPLPLVIPFLPIPWSLFPGSLKQLASQPHVDLRREDVEFLGETVGRLLGVGTTVIKWGLGWWVLIPLRTGRWAFGV